MVKSKYSAIIFNLLHIFICKSQLLQDKKKNVACPLWATVNDYSDSLFITLKY